MRRIALVPLLLVAVLLAGCFPVSPLGPRVLFSDDFEAGFADEWVIAGGWYFTDGVLRPTDTAIGSDDWAYVGSGANWIDYTVEVDIHPQAGWVAVVVRCSQDLRSYVLIGGSATSLQWKVVQDRTTVLSGGGIQPGFSSEFQRVRVEVVGTSYRFFIDGLQRIEFESDVLTQGLPSLATSTVLWGTAPQIDNYRVTEPE